MNINGWSSFAPTNSDGAQILTEPAQMGTPSRGILTDQNHIHIVWDSLVDDELKGSQISSYYLQWDKGTNGVSWYDLVGLADPYLQLEYIAYFGDIVPGSNYQFRLKAQNEYGLSQEWSPITTITANARPNPVTIPVTAIQDDTNVRISWTTPSDNYSSILQYEILIMSFSGTFYQHSDCTGSDPLVTQCDVSITSLREGNFLLT